MIYKDPDGADFDLNEFAHMKLVGKKVDYQGFATYKTTDEEGDEDGQEEDCCEFRWF